MRSKRIELDPMTAGDILALLAQRHSGDVFVPECKDGPTVGSSHLRMDAWAMAKSWTAPTIWGYEIKRDRKDFLRDQKLEAYIDYCNEFYLVCPWGVIQPAEVPAEAGLLWVTKTGNRLHQKKKAVYRRIEFPENVVRYILICRAKIDREYSVRPDQTEHWRQWLADKKEKQEIGYQVSRRLKEKYSEDVTKVQTEQLRLEKRLEAYERLEALLRTMGIEPELYSSWQEREVKNRLEKLEAVIDPKIISDIADATRELNQLHARIEAAVTECGGKLPTHLRAPKLIRRRDGDED